MSPFWRFARRMLRYRTTLILAVVMAFVSALSLGGGLLGIVQVLRTILGDNETLRNLALRFNESSPVNIPDAWINALPTDPFMAVVLIIIALGVLTIFGAAANFMHAYLSLTVTMRAAASIRRDAFRTVVHLPLRTILGRTSETISRILNDTNVLLNGFNVLVSRALADLSKGLVALCVAIYLDWRLTVVAILVAPMLYTIVRKLGKVVRRASRGAMRAQARLLETATESLQGVRVVKVYTNERYELGRFSRHNREVVREQLRARTARALASPLTETVTLFVIGILALIAANAIIDGDMELGNFIGALAGLAVAGGSLKPITKLVQEIQASNAAAIRIAEVLDQDPEPFHLFDPASGERKRLDRHQRDVVFENVVFTYPDAETPAVDDASLTIRHGETVAFVGPNGSGKTTLLSLIPRLFDADSGRILIDGMDISEVALRSLRRQIGVVTQEVVLFRATIAENIAYGRRGASREEIIEAAHLAGAEDFIAAKPGGYDAVVGEQGLTLSGGQRQRLAIARAILRDPSILILDEATSMIDADSERRIGEAIGRFSEGRTCLIVAHRLSTILHADRIVVMDAGRIVDVGRHGELLKRSSVYTQIAGTQLTPSPVEAG